MNGQSKDRRIRKTRRALRDALATLMAKKNIRDISVQELVDLADLNRATFYLHYKDIYDLLHQIENEVVEEINAIIDLHMPNEKREPYPFFVALMQYIEENVSLCNMLLGENSNHSFLEKLCAIIEDRCLRTWLSSYGLQNAEEELSYFSSYMIYGYVAVITKWFRAGMPFSPEKLARMMGGMGVDGIGFLDHIQQEAQDANGNRKPAGSA